jgi:hypothetical protein
MNEEKLAYTNRLVLTLVALEIVMTVILIEKIKIVLNKTTNRALSALETR